ncbi:hypothetical protein [Neorhizobium sp. JUb45]|uniref:hypothetical protein n=1 Tax=Neorhizobium sp. JUb45 TaxID=2485113 RepID=UPI00104EA3CD|nr:hypothetical protein [Neorhizobium sp. JUb45]TCQ99332.1 hypothetical protein EDF70_10937 [Neorhizobium sp. JUb45]
MPTFKVSCTIAVEADDPKEAAIKVVGQVRRDPPATYDIEGQDGYRFHFQLTEEQLEDAIIRIWYG